MSRKAVVSRALLFAASLVSYAMPAFAGPLRVTLTASVADVWDPDGVLGATIAVGDAVIGSYTYDSGTPKSSRSWAPAVADYWQRAAPLGIEVKIGRSTFKTDPDRVEFLIQIIDNDSGRDQYLVRSDRNLALPSGVVVDQIAWRLDDVSQRALSSVELPARPPSLGSWQSIFGLSIEGHDPSEPCKRFFLRAHVTSAR